MNKILASMGILLILSLIFSACSPVSIGIQLPGGSDAGGSQEDVNTLLYAVMLIAGLAVVIALASGIRRP
jgi:hypothetical protein